MSEGFRIIPPQARPQTHFLSMGVEGKGNKMIGYDDIDIDIRIGPFVVEKYDAPFTTTADEKGVNTNTVTRFRVKVPSFEGKRELILSEGDSNLIPAINKALALCTRRIKY